MKKLGMLCHITSLPNKYGVGDFGQSAFEFIDFLKQNNFSIWEVLPLGLTNENNCPYGTMSLYTFDESFVDLDDLINQGLLNKDIVLQFKKYAKTKKVDYANVKPLKYQLFEQAYNNLKSQEKDKLKKVVKSNEHIADYAYYKIMLSVFNTNDWTQVDKKYWNRTSATATKLIEKNSEQYYKYVFFQSTLLNQWQKLKKYANENGIEIFGDLPIYCERQSVDVFYNPKCIKLNEQNMPIATGGCPADDDYPINQDWGTCVYDWEHLKKTKYKYMVDRIKSFLGKYDYLRLDHFMGYISPYENSKTENYPSGRVVGGRKEFFAELAKAINMKRIIVEDIGYADEFSKQVLTDFNIKNMNVLQFALQNENNYDYFSTLSKNSVTYLGTHDNNTFMGFLKKLNKTELIRFRAIMNCDKKSLKDIQIDCLHKLTTCKSDIVIVPIQDFMLENEKFRMNVPGQAKGCWEYKARKNYKKIIVKTLSKLK